MTWAGFAASAQRLVSPAGEWSGRHVANLLTVLRLLLSPPVVLLVLMEGSRARTAAALLFIVAALTDLLDGYLARRHRKESTLGAFLDPLADKLLVDGALIALAVRGDIPILLALFFVVRDAGITLLRILSSGQRAQLRPGALAKLKTAGISTGVALLLVGTAAEGSGRTLIVGAAWGMIWLSVLLNLASILEYAGRLLLRRSPRDRDEL